MIKYPKYFKADNEVYEIAKAMELAGARTFVAIAERRRDAERQTIESGQRSYELDRDGIDRKLGIIECLNWLIELPEKTQKFLNKLPENIKE